MSMMNVCAKRFEIKRQAEKHYFDVHFLDMSDTEIGEIIGISRCSVYRGRMKALDIIRENYTEE